MTAAVSRLADIQQRLRQLTEPLPASLLYRQVHPDLSPLAWHYGHCAFIETYWIREFILGDRSETGGWHQVYFPELSYKPSRASLLAERDSLFEWADGLHTANLELLADPPATLRHHPLLRDDYLPLFLLQHHAQHLEIMHMVLAQSQPQEPDAAPETELRPQPPEPEWLALPGGDYQIGHDAPEAFDNERSAVAVTLRDCRLARRPVSNAEFCAFVEAGIYRDPSFWCKAGRSWQKKTGAEAPDGWRRGAHGWYRLTPEGPAPLVPHDAVTGLSWYEASAFARWAGARLPHEYEWEAACTLGLLEGVGETWEWCANSFHPYPGFRAFPYDGYSLPWFDGIHYTLRGGSHYTHPCILRPSFRNFYTADKRHIFAGCRLATDDQGLPPVRSL